MTDFEMPTRDSSNGVHYKGCFYDSSREAFWSGLLGFCGCGDSDRLIDLLIKYLRWCQKKSMDERNAEYIKGSYTTDVTLFMAYICDSADLTEHGAGIGWPWITPHGAAWLKELEGLDTP